MVSLVDHEGIFPWRRKVTPRKLALELGSTMHPFVHVDVTFKVGSIVAARKVTLERLDACMQKLVCSEALFPFGLVIAPFHRALK